MVEPALEAGLLAAAPLTKSCKSAVRRIYFPLQGLPFLSQPLLLLLVFPFFLLSLRPLLGLRLRLRRFQHLRVRQLVLPLLQ